jgi:hypothetical protein
MLARFATSVVQGACPALLAKVIRERPLGMVMQPLDLVLFEHAVFFALSKKRLKVCRKRLDGLVGQYFARLDVFHAIGVVVRHIVPLNHELFARRWHLAREEEFRDAEHLLKMARVVAWHRQQVLPDLVVPARGQIDILDVSGHLTIKDSADKNVHGLMKAGFVFFNDGGLIREVVLTTLCQAVL